jgi:hypothetical protein
MKDILSDKDLSHLTNIPYTTLRFWKKNKPLQYKSIKLYFSLKVLTDFLEKKIDKTVHLTEIVRNECKCNEEYYIEDLSKTANEIDKLFKEIKKIYQEN